MFDRLVELALQCIGLLIPFVVVNDFERGVVLRCGKFHRELEPGFHWKIPFDVDVIYHDNVVPRTINLKAQSLCTQDGKSIVLGGVVTAKIVDIRKALLEVETIDNVLEDSCYGAIAQCVASHPWDVIRTEAFGEILTKACRKRAWKYGTEIMSVQVGDLAPSRALRLYNQI